MCENQNITIHSLASLAETRDNETGNHILRTQHYVRLLAETLCEHVRFRAELTPKTIDLLFKSATAQWCMAKTDDIDPLNVLRRSGVSS